MECRAGFGFLVFFAHRCKITKDVSIPNLI